MKKTLAFLVFIFNCNLIFSQDKLVKDLDNDGKNDTCYFDTTSLKIVCQLSSQKFNPISSKSIEVNNVQSGLKSTKKGFEFFNDWMRSGYKCQFRFNSKLKKMQLIGMSIYSFGNFANDGGGEASANLLTQKYVGNWNFYDFEKEMAIKIPTIKTTLKFPIITLDKFEENIIADFEKRSAELYEKHRKIEEKNQ